MMMPEPVPGTFVQAAPAATAPAATEPAATESASDHSKPKLGPGAKITTVSLPLHKLPRSRLSEAAEVLNPDWDATITAHLGSHAMSALIWMMTKVRPDLKVTELRVQTYEELYQRFETAQTRRLRTNPQEHRQAIAALETADTPWEDDKVLQFAEHFGFQKKW